MKNILRLCFFALAGLLATNAHAQTMIKISLDVSQMTNVDCNLNAGVVPSNKVYMHSGLCASSSSFCNSQILPSNSMAWEHVSGNWGMDDNIGLMTYVGNSTWEMTMDVEAYYSNAANITQGGTPMPSGATPYLIGLVFRSFDGTYEGKDNLCGDIFIKDLQGNPTAVNSADGTPFSPVTVQKLTSLEDTDLLAGAQLYPNPAAGAVHFAYTLKSGLDQVTISVYDALGREVSRLFEGSQSAGAQELIWDAHTGMENGMYQVVMHDGREVMYTGKVLIAH